MKIYAKIKAKLISYPHFRERRNRGIGLMKMSLRDCGLYEKWEVSTLTIEELLEVSKKYDSFRHEYDAVQKENVHLRGEDYRDGKALAQQKILDFGHEMRYNQDIKNGL